MNKKLWTWLLILASVAAGLFLRIYSVSLPYFDKKAAQEVRDAEAQSVRASVAKEYPLLDEASRARLTQKIFEERLREDRGRLKQETARRAEEMKDRYRDERGAPYLVGIDSYYWTRLLGNLLSRGRIGDREVDGLPYDDLLGRPIDPTTKNNIHLWLGFLFIRAASVFDPGAPLSLVLFLVPLVLSCAIGIFSFFTARKLGANDLGALMASVAINISPFLVVRGASEWFDTDIYNVFFPLAIFGVFLYACQPERRVVVRRVVLCSLAGLLTAFYASTWKGWWFIFDIILLSGVLYLLNLKQSQKEENLPAEILRHHGTCLTLFFAFASLFVVLLNGFSTWGDCLVEPLRLASILKVTEASMWPNVFLTVAELGGARGIDVVRSLGGQLVFFSGLIGLLYMALFEHGLRNSRRGFGLLCLAFWITATFYSALEAFRFTLLLVVPIGLAFGLAVTKFYEGASWFFSRYLAPQRAVLARGAFVFFLALYPVVNIADLYTRLSLPPFSIDDQWHGVLTKIKDQTPRDAVIDSWWDFGHWFKAVAQRRVLFDGMTQNTPYAYWMASALLTEDPKEFLGILRMINANGNRAVDELTQAERMALPDAVSLVRRCLSVSEAEARGYLEAVLPPARARKVLSFLFPAALPPVFVIVSYDMPAKISPISYIGNWDFSKVDLWFKQKHQSKEEFLKYAQDHYHLTPQEAQARYLEILFIDKKASRTWFSRFLDYYSPIGTARKDENMLYFDNGVNVNTDNEHVFVQSPDAAGRGIPRSLVTVEKGRLREVKQEKPDLSYSAILFDEKGERKSLLCDTALAKSMLVRMYFFQGEGLDFLKLFDKSVDDKGNVIYVYQVIWPDKKPQATGVPAS
ncbi:MAG: STT3 domain-containing protein [Candidatus Omnitrophica bacterium]|nr:STT3 domain-containing protein [Candidatus Omnitrophota bacterium]